MMLFLEAVKASFIILQSGLGVKHTTEMCLQILHSKARCTTVNLCLKNRKHLMLYGSTSTRVSSLPLLTQPVDLTSAFGECA